MATIDFSRGDEFWIGDDLLHVRRSDDDDLGVSIDYGDALTINFDFAQSMQIMDALLALNEMVDVEKIVVNSLARALEFYKLAQKEKDDGIDSRKDALAGLLESVEAFLGEFENESEAENADI